MKKILLSLLLLLSLSLQATNYYVETSENGGNDSNTGLLGSPVATLSRAAALATSSGDSIIFGAGTFTHTAMTSIAVGVSIRGVDSTQTIINCSYTFAAQSFSSALLS